MNSIGSPDSDKIKRKRIDLTLLNLSTKILSVSNYQASNAYNATVNVEKILGSQYGIADDKISFLNCGGGNSINYKTRATTFKMDNYQASTELPSLMALIVMSLSDPYVNYDFNHSKPSIGSPREISVNSKYLRGDVHAIIFYSGNTGKIFKRLPSDQIDHNSEAAELIKGLDSPIRSIRVDTAKRINEAGLISTHLYDKVAELLKSGYGAATESDSVDEMAWLCKALATSADVRYRSLLEEVAAQAPNAKLQKYARQSLDSYADYQERNQVLNDSKNWDYSLTVKENQIVNMLNSDSSDLKREAAKTILQESQINEDVYDAVSSALNGMLELGSLDNLSVDTMSWLCRALGASRNSKYNHVLKLATLSGHKKLRKFATVALQELRQ